MIESFPDANVAANIAQYRDRVLRFPSIDFSKTITDQNQRQFYDYRDQKGENLYLIPYNQAVEDRITKQKMGAQFEVLGKIRGVNAALDDAILVDLLAVRLTNDLYILVSSDGRETILATLEVAEYYAALLKEQTSPHPGAGSAGAGSVRNDPWFSLNAKAGMMSFIPRSLAPSRTSTPILSGLNGVLGIQQRLFDPLSIHLRFDRDPILMNRFFVVPWVDLGFIEFGLGPYFDLFNTSNMGMVNPGLSLGLKIAFLQDRVFGSFRMDFPFQDINARNYTQTYGEIQVGVSIKPVLVAFTFTSRTFEEQKNNAANSISSWARYDLSGEIPYQGFGFGVHLGYQNLRMASTADYFDYEYSGAYLGLGVPYTFLQATKVFLDAEAPIYPVMSSSTTPVLLQIYLGMTWNIR
jgi:hypothetical protein